MNGDRRARWLTAIAIAALIVLGGWLRLRHLGDLALVGDEGIQALAAAALRAGVPRFDSGYIYTKSLPLVYLQVLASHLFGTGAFALRFPSAVFGALTALPIFLLGAALFGRPVGLISSVLLTVSSWEVELSRYGRPYAMFQCAYVTALLFFFLGFVRGDKRYRWWFVAATLLAFALHPFGLLLVTCFAVPFAASSRIDERKTLVLSALGVAGLCLGYLLACQLLIASGVTSDAPAFSPLLGWRQPPLRALEQMAALHRWYIGVLLAAGIAATAAIARVGFARGQWLKRLIETAVIWSALAAQAGVIAILLSVYAVAYGKSFRVFRERPLRFAIGVAAICLAAWVAVEALVLRSTGPEIVIAMLGYPDFAGYWLYWFVIGWPIMTAVFAAGSLWFLGRWMARREIATLFVLCAFFLPAFVAAAADTYHESRYAFHLYPLVIIVFAVCAVVVQSRVMTFLRWRGDWTSAAVAVAMTLFACVVSQDANLLRAWDLGNRTYQSPRDPMRSVVSWAPYATFHQDQESSSLFVKTHEAPGDVVVGLGSIHTMATYRYYLGRLDYSVGQISEPYRFSLGHANGGPEIDYVTGGIVLPDEASLLKLAAHTRGRVWILGDRPLFSEGNKYYDSDLKRQLERLVREAEFVGRDGQTFAAVLR